LLANGTRGDEALAVVPALIILALWVALLAPGVVKWIRNHRRSTSIASFHRQLRKLERTGPKLVEPAYRLGGQDDHDIDGAATEPPATVPRLVLVPTGASEREHTMRYEDRHQEHRGAHIARRHDTRRHDGQRQDTYAAEERFEEPWERPEAAYDPPTRTHRTVRAPRYDAYEDVDHEADDDRLGVLTPERARTRRMRILAGLGGAIGASLLLGLVTGIAILWAITLVSVVALLGYLVLMFYASSAGMYGTDALAEITPVARSVVPAYAERAYRFDDDEDWEPGRIAAAR
jgi:hypothetical protein